MSKKMTPKSQAKGKPQFPQYPLSTIFNPKKYHANKYTILSFNCTIWIYITVYDCTICTLNYYEEHYEDKCLAGCKPFCTL